MRLVVGVIVVSQLGWSISNSIKGAREVSRADREAKAQKPEIAECQARLAMFYDAWSRYRADHKGTDPGSVKEMIPKYISSFDLLVCPTAKRWAANRVTFEQGTVEIGPTKYPETYGFKWTSAGFPRFVKRYGDIVPLVECTAHTQAMYYASYGRMPTSDVLEAGKSAGLIAAVRSSPTLAVRRNGKVEPIDLGNGQ